MGTTEILIYLGDLRFLRLVRASKGKGIRYKI
jgi:hypothetical protein